MAPEKNNVIDINAKRSGIADSTPLADCHYIVLKINNRKYDFTHAEVLHMAVQELKFRSETTHEIDLHLCLILPKELHILLQVSETCGKPLANWVKAYKVKLSRDIGAVAGVKISWAPGFDDRPVADTGSFKELIKMILSIPMERDLLFNLAGLPFVRALPE